MTVVNNIRRLETAVPPNELLRFEGQYPHILKELQVTQTLISQLIIRTGGSGPGAGVVNLDGITESVDQLENQDAEALIVSLAGRVSHLESMIHDMQSDFTSDTRAIDAIEDLRRETPIDRYTELLSRIEALEAQL